MDFPTALLKAFLSVFIIIFLVNMAVELIKTVRRKIKKLPTETEKKSNGGNLRGVKRVFVIIAGLSLLITALSIGYYFVIVLPSQSKSQEKARGEIRGEGTKEKDAFEVLDEYEKRQKESQKQQQVIDDQSYEHYKIQNQIEQMDINNQLYRNEQKENE